MLENLKIENQAVDIPMPERIMLMIRWEDKNRLFVSGNKLRKLKYNIVEATKQGKSILPTSRGTYFNHIMATTTVGQVMELRTIGMMGGDELKSKINANPTLKFAKNCGT